MSTETPGVAPVHTEVDRPAAEASPAVITSGTDPATQEEHTVQPTEPETAPKPVTPKPAFRPTMKPTVAKTPAVEPESPVESATDEVPKPKAPAPFRPTMKPKTP